jgi:hypothetical protein
MFSHLRLIGLSKDFAADRFTPEKVMAAIKEQLTKLGRHTA